MRRPVYRHAENDAHSRRRIRPNVFARIVRWMLQGRLLVIVLWAVLAAAGGTYSALTTSLDMRDGGLVAPDPQRAASQRALETAFPGTGEPILAVVESADPHLARESAANLSSTLAGEPAFFGDVFAPGTGRFFDEYGILYLDATAVEDIVRRIEQQAPLYRAIAASPDLAGLAALAAQAARAIAEGRSPQGLNALFQEAALTVKGHIADQRHDLDWPSLVEHSAQLDSTRWFVLAVPVARTTEFDPYSASVSRARKVADDVVAAAHGTVSVTLTGRPVVYTDTSGSLSRAVLMPALLSGLLVLVILGFGLSRPGLIVANLLALVLGFMAFAGAVALIAPRLDRVTLAVPLIYLGTAVLAMIAMTLRAEEGKQTGLTANAALMLAAQRLGPSFFAWTIAVAVGGLAALQSSFTSLVTLAILSAAAILVVLGATLTLLPALLGFTSSTSGENDSHWLDLVLEGPAPAAWYKLRQGLTVTLIVVAVMFAALVPQVKVEKAEGPVLQPGPAARIFRDLSASEPSLLAAAHVLAKPGEEARALAVRLAALPEVASVRRIESFLPPGETQKRQILARLQGVLPKLPEQSPEPEEEKLRTELARLEQHLLDIANDPRTAADLKAASSELRRSLALFTGPRPPAPEAIRRLENALFVRLPLLFERVERLASLPALSTATLDPDIVRHYVGVDGSWRIEVAPREPGDIHGFAEAITAVAPNAAGSALVNLSRPTTMRMGLGYLVAGLLALTLVMAPIAARSILGSVRLLIPPAVVTLIAAGTLVLAARPLHPEDMSLVIATVAMTAGMGFIAERWQAEPSLWPSETSSPLPRTLLLAFLLFPASFATLMLSSSPTFENFGELNAVAAGLLLGAAFMVAPQLAAWTLRRDQ